MKFQEKLRSVQKYMLLFVNFNFPILNYEIGV